MLKGFVQVRYIVLRCAKLRTPRTGVWAVSNGLGSMDPDPHLVLDLSLTVFFLQLFEFIQLLSTQLNDIGLCPSFWISTNKLTQFHDS